MLNEPVVRAILTVSALTARLRTHIETTFDDVWVEGEVSNLRVPTSGHAYFTLKDATSQLRAVLFRSSGRALRFVLQDGIHLVCRGRITVYDPRGEYQLVVEQADPKGIGALQLAFEQLKGRLAAEGLFDAARKRALPFLPRRIGVVTSSTGAAIRDIIQVIHARDPGVYLVINPVVVQGDAAAAEIARAIAEMNELGQLELLIVGRGGGSMEDLWPFNEEIVARAIAASRIPVISAVGHETDFTIADFVADLRAPTPSAAAELAVRDRRELRRRLQNIQERMAQAMWVGLRVRRRTVEKERRSLLDPAMLVQRAMQRRDDLEMRLRLAAVARVKEVRVGVNRLRNTVLLRNPIQQIKQCLTMVPHLRLRLEQRMWSATALWRRSLEAAAGALDTLSPLAVLDRGYSITRRWPEMTLLKAASGVIPGDVVQVRLASGELLCEVKRAEDDLQMG